MASIPDAGAVQAAAPADAIAHYNNGVGLHQQGRLTEALACYEAALALAPHFPEVHNNLGLLFAKIGDAENAIHCYHQALTIKPDFAEAHNNLGNTLKSQGRLEAAISCFLNALALKIDFVEAHSNLGLAFAEQGKFAEAATCYETAIVLKPDYAIAHNNLGSAFKELGKFDEALKSFIAALDLKPDYAMAYANLASLFQEFGRPDEAIAYCRKALEYQPDFLNAHNNLLLNMQYSRTHTPEEMFCAHAQFGKCFEASLQATWPRHTNLPDARKRLKIGYVSPDFRRHSVAYFIEPILACHDRSSVEVFCYYNHSQIDPVTLRLQQLADHWIACKYLSDEQLAARIQADGIDILVDLAGHTGGNRLLTFARKPAPVQVTYLGYPATTGLSAIDYRLTDAYAEPPGMTESLNVERLWRLPDLFCCYRAHDHAPDVVDHPPALDNGFVTFGCFNNFSKLTDPVLALWAKIVQRLPAARLMLEIAGLDDPGFRAEVEQRLAGLGLPMERMWLVPRRPQNQYVLYNQIDIALDPFPCNGGTTSLDTLYMGVPFVTLAGRHFTSRMGVSILSNAGLGELIAVNDDDYADIAVGLAADLPRLAAMRHHLRQRVQASPLMDAPRFTQHLELAYRDMWKQWCATKNEHETRSFA